MLNAQGMRVQDQNMAERISKRAFMLPQQDEFYRNDKDGNRITGAFDRNGHFMVEPNERREGYCDKAGYLVDRKGNRLVDYQMKERIRKRSYPKPQPDEYFRIDDNGIKVSGGYDLQGYFIVEDTERHIPGRCDENGYMLSANGTRLIDEVIRDRFRVRATMRAMDDEFYATDANKVKVNGKYDRRGRFIVDVLERSPERCDEDGYLIDADGKIVRNNEIKERKK